MMDDMFLDAFTRLLDDVSTPAAVRAAHHDGDGSAIWAALQESGFVDALIPEDAGGAGLSRGDVVPLLLAAGERLVPVAFGHTMVARMIAASAGQSLPVEGPVALWPTGANGKLRSQVAPAAVEAGHALVQRGGDFALLPVVTTQGLDGFGYVAGEVDLGATPLLTFTSPDVELFDWAAALTAVSAAGAINRVLDMSLAYVTERQQFGRPLGNFQAIQHMVAQAAEQSVLATAAARVGFAGEGLVADPLRVAVAKSLTGTAAGDIASIAHAVHGAIGVSEEHNLQLYTRQLRRWIVSYGSDLFWSQRIADARLSAPQGTSVDFIRARLAAVGPA